jgi:hypothetical protein
MERINNKLDMTILTFTTQVEKVETKFDAQFAKVDARFETLPTKNDLWAWKIQWLAIGLAVVALIVGGIIGGLSIIKNG